MTSAEMATSKNKLKNSLLEKLSAQQSVIDLLKEHETPASRSLPTSRLNPVAR